MKNGNINLWIIDILKYVYQKISVGVRKLTYNI